MRASSDAAIGARAASVLRAAQTAGLRIATAESCTGGLLSAVLTEIEGMSHVFERGFVVYTDEAKRELLGVAPATLERCGAVSAPCAAEMAEGALTRSRADVAVSITGYAGESGPDEQPGLVYFGLAVRGRSPRATEAHFPPDTRARVRLASLRKSLDLLAEGIAIVAQTQALNAA
jgi:nicotinamide-nucleotide amidase